MSVVNYMAHVAKQHTAEMESKYTGEIKTSINGVKEYTEDTIRENVISSNYKTNVHILDMDSVTAIFSSKFKEQINPNINIRIAVLNFASYKNPGGRFIDGSRAQEEALCHESTLYNVLKEFDESYYKPNRDRLNNALYHSNLLYVPRVVFERDSIYAFSDVITCAAPNKGVAMRYGKVSKERYLETLRERIDAVLYSAYDNHVDTLILGAFGCGVFKNDPSDVAVIFKEFIDTKYNGVFKEIIFPIPQDKKRMNLDTFRKVFNK